MPVIGRRGRAIGVVALLLGVGGGLLWLRARDPAGGGATGTANSAAGHPAAADPGGRNARSERTAAPPRFVAVAPPAPRWKPAASQAYRTQRHNWDARTPPHFFQREDRSEPWAGEMERTLQGRFDQRSLRRLGIPGLRADRIECRASSCALEVSWDDQDQALARSKGVRARLDPLSLVTSSIGPLAATEFRERPRPGETAVPDTWAVRRREDGRLAVRDFILFGDHDIDPDGYLDWVERLAANTQAAADLVR